MVTPLSDGYSPTAPAAPSLFHSAGPPSADGAATSDATRENTTAWTRQVAKARNERSTPRW